MSNRSGRVTMATIAASAGVSIATVSKVLNGRSDVAPATRALVRSLLAEHGYVHPSSRHQAADRPIIDLHVAGGLCPYSLEIIKGAVEAGTEAGVTVAVTAGEDAAGDDGVWTGDEAAAGQRMTVVLAAGLSQARLSALSRTRVPVVVVDPLDVTGSDVTSIGSTNFAGGLSATRHLLTLGHRRIAYLGGPASAVSSQRLHGYRAAMEDAGVPVPPGYVRTAGFCHDDGVREGGALLDLPTPPTAVFAACDETALGVVHAARTRGLRIPGDLSVVGFDDIDIAAMTSPRLTTVRQPLREMGMAAVRTALRLAGGETIESHHIELATELVVRESAAAPHHPTTSPLAPTA